MFKSVGAAAFFAAWRGLSQTTLVPHYRDAFQQLPPDLLPWIAIVEEAPKGEYVIRFMGTARVEMWGRDLTGTNALAIMAPAIVQATRRNMEVILTHPCGLHHVSHYATPSGREAYMENITVPAGNDPGAPRRLLNFVAEVSTITYGEPAGEVRSVSARTWLDIGGGIPQKPPAK